MILFLLTLVLLMGFGALAVDYGVLVNDKNRLQRACDASALAAAQELKVSGDDSVDTNNAVSIAIAVAAENGVSITAEEISFSENFSNITVSANLKRGLFFARVLGVIHGNTAASATAGVGGVASNYTPYVAPIGIVKEDYDAYNYDPENYDPSDTERTFNITRHNKDALESGGFVLFDLRPQPSKSPAKMVDQLLGKENEYPVIYDSDKGCTNYSCQTSLNASLNSEGPKFGGAIEELKAKAAGAPWYDTGSNGWYDKLRLGQADYSNPRVINVIVTNNAAAKNGTSNMPVLAFVPVYIVGYDKQTGDLAVQFLPTPNIMEGDLVKGATIRKLQLLG